MKKFILILETWTETESGWGCRPDGITLHLTKEDCEKYVKAYWKRQPNRVNGQTPYEYTREDGNLKPVQVSKKLYDEVKKASKKFGVRYWQSEYRELKKEKQIEYLT